MLPSYVPWAAFARILAVPPSMFREREKSEWRNGIHLGRKI